MPLPMHTFRSIKVHLYTVVAVALAVGVLLLGLFIALEWHVLELRAVADDYHLASSGLSSRIQMELLTIDRVFSELELLRKADVGDSESTAAEQDERYGQVAASAQVLMQSVDEMVALQERFGDPTFETTTARLLDAASSLEMLTVRGVEREIYFESTLPELSIVGQQLYRMHLSAHNDSVERIRAIRAENVVYFAAVSAVAFLICVAASRRSISGIRAVVAENEANQEMLSESESRLQSILDTAADGIITIDELGSVVSFNDTAAISMSSPHRRAVTFQQHCAFIVLAPRQSIQRQRQRPLGHDLAIH